MHRALPGASCEHLPPEAFDRLLNVAKSRLAPGDAAKLDRALRGMSVG